MLNVMLVSMPYTILTMPSIGIAQLQAVVHGALGDRVKVDAAYCYLDFAEFIGGPEVYDTFGVFDEKGLNDWLFRGHAFDAADNLEQYQRSFFSDGIDPRKRDTFQLMLDKRKEVGAFLDHLIERYRLATYDVIGFTSMMSQNIASFALARRLKSVVPRIITVLGGPNAEHPMGKAVAANVAQIDYVFSGPALVNFPAFLRAVLAEEYQALSQIKGVHARVHTETRRVANSRTGSFAGIPIGVSDAKKGGASCSSNELENNSGDEFNLNEMPLLSYDGYLARVAEMPFADALRPHLVLPFETSTGCWWADKVVCSFCGQTPHAFRQMTPEKARAYIGGLIERYADKFSIFEATDSCMPVEYPKQVFPYVNQDKRVILQYEVKAKMTSPELREMAEANAILPQPGIESLSTRTLKVMRKGVTAFHNVQFLKYCTEHGLYPIWNYLYGFPNDNYDELDSDKLVDDIQTLCHLPPPCSNIPIGFPRYSEYYNEQAKYGLKLRPLDEYFYIYPFSEEVIGDLAYAFVDHEFSEKLQKKHAKAIRANTFEIVNWMLRFREAIPKLHFVSELVIEDTREETPAKYRIQKTDRDVLTFLNEPHSLEDVQKQFSLSRAAAEAIIDGLRKNRLLFCERDKYLNVVCERCALTGDIYRDYYINFVKNSSTAFD